LIISKRAAKLEEKSYLGCYFLGRVQYMACRSMWMSCIWRMEKANVLWHFQAQTHPTSVLPRWMGRSTFGFASSKGFHQVHPKSS